MRKILVTGGLGFIGYHLIKHLFHKYKDLQITVIDNLSSTQIDFSHLYSHLHIIIKDLLEYEMLNNEFSDIYHLASPVGSLGILTRNGFVAKNIIDLTYKVVDIAKQCKARLLFVSSSEVYGHSGMHDENAVKLIGNIYGTRTEYALGKLTSEIILQNLNICNKLAFNTARPFNVVGEHQSSKIGFVFPAFFENALLERDIEVFYDGSQKRSFCHVEDIVKALVAIQESDVNGEIFNVGHDRNTTTILDLALRIKLACNSASKIVHIDPVKKFGRCYVEAFDKIPDIKKISGRLGWRPEIDLNSAIERLLHYYRQ